MLNPLTPIRYCIGNETWDIIFLEKKLTEHEARKRQFTVNVHLKTRF